jgi:DNA polymerase III subunit epsilon
MRSAAPRHFVAFDLETTGLFAESDRVVEIGAVRFEETGRELGRYQRLVNPGRPMSPAAQRVHGISDADLAEESTADVVLPAFLDWLGDPVESVLLAHNAHFDAGFLGRELVRLSLPLPSFAVIDTLALARRRLPMAPSHRLDTLALLLGLDQSDSHRALADALRVKELWIRLGGSDDRLVSFPLFDPCAPPPPPLGWDGLAEAIAAGDRVRIEYAGGSRGSALREISPRRFIHKGGVAYVVALCHVDDFEKSFRLDRIERYEIVRATTVQQSFSLSNNGNSIDS